MSIVDTSLYYNEINSSTYQTLLIGRDISTGAVRAYYINSQFFAETLNSNFTMFLTYNNDGTISFEAIPVTIDAELSTVQVQNNTNYKINIILSQQNPETIIVNSGELSTKIKAPNNNTPQNICPNLQVYVDLSSDN